MGSSQLEHNGSLQSFDDSTAAGVHQFLHHTSQPRWSWPCLATPTQGHGQKIGTELLKTTNIAKSLSFSVLLYKATFIALS